MPLPMLVVPRSMPRYWGESARPTMVYSVPVSPAGAAPSSSVRWMTVPMSPGSNTAESARHSPSASGRRPAVREGSETSSGKDSRWSGCRSSPHWAMASRE